MNKLLTFLVAFIIAGSCAGQTYFLNGSATALGGDCYLLTPESPTQNGTVWYGDQINLEEPFDIQFLMNFGDIDGSGADGICFVLQTVGTNAIGESGGGLGYLNFGTSLGIEFDTWTNSEYSDPLEDHIAIEMNGDIDHNSNNNIAGPVQADPLDINIEDGENHVARIVWDPTTQIIQVYFDCVFRVSGEIDMVNTIFGGENLVYWGFTAATGGAWNNQTVCLQENILNTGQEYDVCEGGSVVLLAGSSIDGVYEWTPATYLDDSTIPNPTATPVESIEYNVSFINLCNQAVELQFQVNVAPLEVTVGNIDVLNCITTLADIQAAINFNTDATFTWSLDGTVITSGENQDLLFTDQPGIYTVEANVQDVCFSEVSFEVEANYETYTADAGDDATLNCYNENLTLTGETNGNDGTFIWDLNGNVINGANTTSLDISNPGTYSFNVVHPISGCIASDDIVINSDFSSPTISIGEQDSLTCIKPQILISGVEIISQHDYSISWETNDGVIAGGGTTSSPAAAAMGTYQITVQDIETGCISIDEVFIGESEDFNIDLTSLLFPNIVTANGDSQNDIWQPFLQDDTSADLSSVFTEFELTIFNRWGNQVFESKSYSSAWTGRDQAQGIYYYILKYKTLCDQGKSGVVDGYVHLLK